jgi:hypothetical protein
MLHVEAAHSLLLIFAIAIKWKLFFLYQPLHWRRCAPSAGSCLQQLAQSPFQSTGNETIFRSMRNC